MGYKVYDIKNGVARAKSKFGFGKKTLSFGALSLAGVLAFSSLGVSAASTTVVVTPNNTQGWSTADTRPGGEVNYVSDPTSPYPSGALQLTTDGTNAAKAQYLHAASGSLNDVTELSYYTKQVSGPLTADPSYQLAIDVNGAAPGGFTNLVYEPYWNGVVTPGVWQNWNVAAGQFWSSSTVSDGQTCNLVSGAGGPPFYTLEQLKATCPSAVVVGFGVNVGTYNPNYVVEADGVNFNGTTYDFELTNKPSDKDACKNNGYMNLTDQNGQAFKNQGQCVSWTNGRGQ
jgi:hypothetical protein